MMKRLLLSLPILFLVACGAKESQDNDKGKGNEEASHKETGHDEGGHGEAQQLGKMKAHGREFAVVQMGDIHAGEEGAVELEFATGADRITTVRGWVGIESGEGSMKGKFELEGEKTMHGHIDVPSPIPAGSKLWLSFDVDGKVETHSIAYK
mgnify:CR=1 FL=1|tara:strand:- start:15222 stop:15677 length:456 start_codon:yes stop_codon:yes gene_type:complete